MFFGLRDYQLQGAQFVLENPMCGLFFDCGLGKTLTVLSALSHDRESTLPALIVAPVRVAKHVWPDELSKWGFDLTHTLVRGSPALKTRRQAESTDLTIINPESLGCIKSGRWRTVIVDESTYFKNKQSKRWKRLAKICKAADRVVLLTGTPIAGRGHIDLWAQFGLFGAVNPLGDWLWFTNQHFSFDIFNRPTIRRGSADLINQAVAPMVLRKSVEELGDDMPSLIELDVVVDMPAASQKRYREIKLEENSYAPLRTLASGFEYDKHWSGDINRVWHHAAKMDALQELITECAGESLLVFANFTAEIDAIAAQFGAEVIDGRTSSAVAGQLIDRWSAGGIPMLVLHPRSAGHGLNLQSGGRRVVWFSLPDSGETWLQANARLYRSGQKADTVFCHKLICAGTIDVVINGLLARKILNEQNLLAAVKR